ncbi:MAG: hypothetical protein QY323_03660 [Patescibacteria group bacterium]|nr:MAG: hypothetical protein QY323_03660 [Patescibacteria group bacterium]
MYFAAIVFCIGLIALNELRRRRASRFMEKLPPVRTVRDALPARQTEEREVVGPKTDPIQPAPAPPQRSTSAAPPSPKKKDDGYETVTLGIEEGYPYRVRRKKRKPLFTFKDESSIF